MRNTQTAPSIKDALRDAGWFVAPGAYVLVDGQFGSTGKGLLAAVLAESARARITVVTTNAGPNSGHTAFSPLHDGKIVTKQIPVGGIVINQFRPKYPVPIYLNGGAIINPDTLLEEYDTYNCPQGSVFVHPNAAIIEAEDIAAESEGSVARIASTGKGVGAALARKVLRRNNVAGAHDELRHYYWPKGSFGEYEWDWARDRVFVETAQGFSLGIQSRFYPATTSRECTVMQALADARIPAQKLAKVAACYRTFPIRVGNTAVGHSGDCYPDQTETTWDAIGQTPEYTTVTNRMRRVFTWSRMQFRESVAANRPDLIFLNFMNYLNGNRQKDLYAVVLEDYRAVMGHDPELVLLGYGPLNGHVKDARSHLGLWMHGRAAE